MSVVKRSAEFNRELPTPLELDLQINDTPFDEEAVKQMDGNWYRREGRICKVLAYLPRQRKILWVILPDARRASMTRHRLWPISRLMC